MARTYNVIMVDALVCFLFFVSACSAAQSGSSHTASLDGYSSQQQASGTSGTAGSSSDPTLSGSAAGGTSTEYEEVAGFAKDECAKTSVNITRNPINVIMLVDRSTTMIISPFGNYRTRWEALRAALMGDPDGLVRQYEGIVRFGYEGFTGFPGDQTGLTCPDLQSVPYDILNYDKILPVYDASQPASLFGGSIGQTPTGESLQVVLDVLENQFISTPDVLTGGPFIIILATDGEPDTCADPNTDGSPAATQLVVDQVNRAFGLGIRTYVLSVGADTSDTHLQDVANAGVGTSNGAPFWKADNDQGLKDALAAIIGEALSCELAVEGEIIDPVKACEEGTVVINGQPVECGSANEGWRVVDSTHIELLGTACQTLKSSPSVLLEASFPCGIIIG